MSGAKGGARLLRDHVESLGVVSGWEYTRDLGDVHGVAYGGEGASFRARLADAVRAFFHRKKSRPWGKLNSLSGRWAAARAAMRANVREPDGMLDGGNILTHWEETGEYVQLMQPSVGLLVADFLDADPGHPFAVLIAAELERIDAAYAARIGGDEGCDCGSLSR